MYNYIGLTIFIAVFVAIVSAFVFFAFRRKNNLNEIAKAYGLGFFNPKSFPRDYKNESLVETFDGREIEVHVLNSEHDFSTEIISGVSKRLNFFGHDKSLPSDAVPAHISKINVIVGKINGHEIEIYDAMSIPISIARGLMGANVKKETFIIIDGEQKNISNFVTGFAPIKKIKEILDTLA